MNLPEITVPAISGCLEDSLTVFTQSYDHFKEGFDLFEHEEDIKA